MKCETKKMYLKSVTLTTCVVSSLLIILFLWITKLAVSHVIVDFIFFHVDLLEDLLEHLSSLLKNMKT